MRDFRGFDTFLFQYHQFPLVTVFNFSPFYIGSVCHYDAINFKRICQWLRQDAAHLSPGHSASVLCQAERTLVAPTAGHVLTRPI